MDIVDVIVECVKSSVKRINTITTVGTMTTTTMMIMVDVEEDKEEAEGEEAVGEEQEVGDVEEGVTVAGEDAGVADHPPLPETEAILMIMQTNILLIWMVMRLFLEILILMLLAPVMGEWNLNYYPTQFSK